MENQKNITLSQNIKEFEKKQIIISLLGLLIFLGLSIIANRLFMQSAADQTAKLITRMIQTQDYREINATLQSAKLDYFHKIEFKSHNHERSFTFPPSSEYIKDKTFLDFFVYEAIVVNSETFSTEGDQIIFEYNRFNYFVYAIIIWFVLNLVTIPQTRLVKRRLIAQFDKDIELQKRIVHTEVSRKVRHNINTPLAALMSMTDRMEKLNKSDKELFQSIVTQIKSLVKDLELSESKLETNLIQSSALALTNDTQLVLIHQLLKESFSEIQLAHSNKFKILTSLDESLMSAKSELIPHEFRSILSNIVQNAVDASTPQSGIAITTKDLTNRFEIKIQDAGRGIPQELLSKVTEQNFSYGKKGSGIGLYHAKLWIEKWNGLLTIDSTENFGTIVTVILPIKERTKWFTPRIKIHSDQTVIVLDDHISQHMVWDIKLREVGFGGEIKSFQTSRDFLNFYESTIKKFEPNKYVYLFDYDLGKHEPKGLELLSQLSPESQRYLVTGHYDDFEIQQRCDLESVYLVSKIALGQISIVID